MEFEDIPRQEVERKMEKWAETHGDPSVRIYTSNKFLKDIRSDRN